MNHFAYKNTTITESKFDFSRVDKAFHFSGEVFLSATIATPKNADSQKPVVCTLELSMGSEEDKIQLCVKSRSVFEITGEMELDTLQDDAKASCCPKAIDVLTERIAELTRLHIGRPLTIQIPHQL